MTHTWGIPGATFLAIYLTLAAVAIIGTLIHRGRLFAGTSAPLDSLHPQQLAYLTGGPGLALQTSLMSLKQAESIEIAETGALSRTWQGLPADATALDSAVLQAAGAGLRTRYLADESNVQRELHSLRQQLEQAGLAVSQQAALAARRGPLVLAGLLALGAARLIAGISGGKPVVFLVLAMVPVLVALIVFLASRPTVTTAAKAALAALRQQYSYLSPRNEPALNTYGAAGTAMAIGLFGGAMLWQADPAFAAAAGVDVEALNRNPGSTGTTTSCGGGGDGGGGGGCGGGGCGG